MITKKSGGGGGGDPPPGELTDKKIILDSNGDSVNPATLTDEDGNTGKTQRDVAVTVNEEDKTKYNDTQLPTSSNINLYRDGYNFIGWNTKADGTGTAYGNGKTFTSDEINSLFGSKDTVTLYAQWEEKIIYIAGDSLYNAMKGNSKQGTKGLEELMTYNTWVAMWKLGKADAYSVYPDTGGSVYNGGRFRTETTNINSSEVSAKKNNFTLFLDLGSDLMYENSSVKGGLFKTSWDLANIATDGNGDTLNSIKANANSGKLSSGSLEITSDGNTNNVYGYYSGSGWRKTLIDKLKFNFKNSSSLAYTEAVKYRVHTSFNFDAVFPVRSNKTTSPKYVNGYAVPATDPLYVRIESEELNEADGDKQNTTARQMFININANNTASNARPLIIFYEGPDRGLTEGVDDSERSDNQSGSPKSTYPNLTWRDSQPVILNLNADFSGILFAPNSPVAINGNGHNLHGFVVAKEFVRVTTASDYTVSNGKYIDANGKEWFKSSQTNNGITNTVFVDEYGNVDTRPLANAMRPLGSAETLAGVPEDDAINQYKAQHSDMEVVYKLDAFNLGSDSYYDSFDIPELKRNVYTYEDNYTDDSKTNSVDMFFTTVRSRWIT